MARYNGVIQIGIYGFFLINIFTNMVKILPTNTYYRELLILEVCIAIAAIMTFRFKLNVEKIGLRKIVIIISAQIVAYFTTALIGDYDSWDFHRLAIFCAIYLVLFEFAKYAFITEDEYYRILRAVIIIGVFACIYNVFLNRSSILTLNFKIIMYYTSDYTSFFLTRSNFCLLLVICYAIVIYFYESRKSKLWILLAIFFATNVFLTNARTSIIAILAVTIYYFLMQKKKLVRNIAVIVLCIVALLLLPWDMLFSDLQRITEEYSLIFRTNTEDISNGRIWLWGMAIKDTNLLSFFIGHGVGSKDMYLSYINAFALSFHNGWIDLFYEGGAIMCIIYIFVFVEVVKIVRHSFLEHTQKKLFYSFLVILFVSSMGDSIALPFLLDSSAIFSSIMFITLPICTVNGAAYIEKNVKEVR